MVRDVAVHNPELAHRALRGLSLYAAAPREPRERAGPIVAEAGAATLRDQGGEGTPILFVPSLINPPGILDLDEEVSLTRAVAGKGFRSLLVDWGIAEQRNLSIGEHVEQLLLPLMKALGEPAVLVGYCLGGTMAVAAANIAAAKAVVTLAAPWRFSAYPDAGRAGLKRLWDDALPGARMLGVLPMEVLQASFWSLDPQRTVAKFAELAEMDPSGSEFRRFVALEDWANDGDPLPLPAAGELLEDMFQSDVTGLGGWTVGGRAIAMPSCPTLHFTAARDRITPSDAAPSGNQIQLPAGHVGMVVGRSRHTLHDELGRFLDACR
ncbi:alpha/beta hydrolase [Sphingomonas piscis]|uniref:Alpha/beta hydrolase n=1 Tax=Sphingomonas piscis TaxID=2714943 RepID=A0A6G7YTL2_9SPHN|nr:alpha/beta hydrolase [Sphingomonas piscis]